MYSSVQENLINWINVEKNGNPFTCETVVKDKYLIPLVNNKIFVRKRTQLYTLLF